MKLEDLHIDYDDQNVYNLFEIPDLCGVFQMENIGTARLTAKIAPKSIEEISDATALIRPGPKDSGQLDEYVKIKDGKKDIESIHPSIDESLKDTYGQLVYQENLMTVLQKMAGWSLQESDIMREAIAKKKKDLLVTLKQKFFDDCINNNISKSIVEKVWLTFDKSAAYLFNKPHSIAYAIIAYRTAWLKTYYPKAFYYGCLNVLERDSDPIMEVRKIYYDAKKHGIHIKVPNHREMTKKFDIRDGNLYWGLYAIKDISDNDIPAIIENGKKCKSFDDFVLGCFEKNVKVSSLRSLIYAGFLDTINGIVNSAEQRSGLRDFMVRRLNIISKFTNSVFEALFKLREVKDIDLENDLPTLRTTKSNIRQNKLDEYTEQINKCIIAKIPVVMMAQKETEYLGPITCDLGGKDTIFQIEWDKESSCKAIVIDSKAKYKHGKLSTNLILHDHTGILFKFLDGDNIKVEKFDIISFKQHKKTFEII